MNFKVPQCFGLLLLLLLYGCMGQQPSPQTEATPAPKLTYKSTETVLIPSFTPESQTPVRSSTKVLTDTPSLNMLASSPTNTPEISLFQEIQSLPKGTYTLIIGNNDTLPDYLYLLLKDTGEVVKRFQLHEDALSVTTDLRFYAYNNGTPVKNYWLDTADTKKIPHPFASDCDKPSWSKDNTQLAMLCGDGVHFFTFKDGNWIEKSHIARPDEINYLPDYFHLLDFPFWMNNGFAFFVNHRNMSNGTQNNLPYHLYILGQECIDDPQKCNLGQPRLVIAEDSLSVGAVAFSENDQLLAVALGGSSKGEIHIYDLKTFKVVNRITLPTNERDRNWGNVGSMIWGSEPNEIILSMNYTPRIYAIPDYQKNDIEMLFDCSAAKVYNCSILSKVIVR